MISKEEFEFLNIYLAGFFDGEGYFGLFKNPKRQCIKPMISIINTNSIVISVVNDWLCFLGINLKIRKIESDNKNHKDVYSIKISSYADVLKVCKTLQPYLIVKSRQASILIEFITLKLLSPKGDFQGDKFSLFKEMKRLNFRGKQI